MMMSKIVVLSVSVFLSVAAIGQTNFSGVWALKSKEHINGPQYSNALTEEITVKQTADSISTGKRSVAMNGKPTSSKDQESNRKIVRSLAWSADKKTATFTTAIYAVGNENEVELTRVDTWALSPDGKELTIQRKSIETKSENWEAKGSYQKKD
jgi:PAB1-binding protein PBP1